MRQALPLAFALTLGLVAAGARADQDKSKVFTKGAPVVLVGEISSQPKKAGVAVEHKMQVAVGPNRTDHTLHLKGAKLFDENGKEIAASDLLDKWWIRAEGTVMDDPRRINVTSLRVLGKDRAGYQASGYFHPDWSNGYVEAVAGSQERYHSTKPFAEGAEVVALGEIISQPKDAGIIVEHKMQVALGPERTPYTLHIKDARIWDVDGKEVAKSDLKDKMWVRAEGKMMKDARRIEVSRLQVVGKDWGDMRAHGYWIPGYERGFLMSGSSFHSRFPKATELR